MRDRVGMTAALGVLLLAMSTGVASAHSLTSSAQPVCMNSTSTCGLTIHCDPLLSNNLEINWDGGSHFRMLERLETVACFDDPAIDQRPPSAPLDTLIGRGTGRYDGVDGYTIEFTLVDAGEPGRSDEIGFVITAPDGSIVINVPVQDLTGGNLQAHFDQPHKR